MPIRDALIVSLAGITVVFLGLLVTSWLISAISLLTARIQRRREAPAAASVPLYEATPPVVIPPPAPGVLAVIAALLDVEMRLHGVGRSERFTFRGGADAHDWRGDAGMRSGQPIKGVR